MGNIATPVPSSTASVLDPTTSQIPCQRAIVISRQALLCALCIRTEHTRNAQVLGSSPRPQQNRSSAISFYLATFFEPGSRLSQENDLAR